jgi:hypothetical protein
MARTSARLPDGSRLSDHVTLGVLTTTIPAAMIDAVLAETGRQSRRIDQPDSVSPVASVRIRPPGLA